MNISARRVPTCLQRPSRSCSPRSNSGFFGTLTEDQADLVVIELARMLSELRAAGLDYQAARVRTVRKRVLAGVEDREPLSPSTQSE